jgi:hypothetical protein
VQGLYGTFSCPERLLQKIWQRGDFDGGAAKTADGGVVKIAHPGRWNHLGGPDFAGAKIWIDGEERVGDVELHLHAKDWEAHGHASDPAYDNVMLHVVLFPCAEKTTRGAKRDIPILCLLPLLHRGLEEYAADEAVERLAGRPLHQAQEILGDLCHEELNTLLARHASERWRAKVGFARRFWPLPFGARRLRHSSPSAPCAPAAQRRAPARGRQVQPEPERLQLARRP